MAVRLRIGTDAILVPGKVADGSGLLGIELGFDMEQLPTSSATLLSTKKFTVGITNGRATLSWPSGKTISVPVLDRDTVSLRVTMGAKEGVSLKVPGTRVWSLSPLDPWPLTDLRLGGVPTDVPGAAFLVKSVLLYRPVREEGPWGQPFLRFDGRNLYGEGVRSFEVVGSPQFGV